MGAVFYLLILGVHRYMDFAYLEKKLIDDCTQRLSTMVNLVRNGLTSLMMDGKGSHYESYMGFLMSEDIETIKLVAPDGRLISSATRDTSAIPNPPIKPELIKDGRGLPVAMYMPFYNGKACQQCHDREKEILAVLYLEVSVKDTRRKLANIRGEAFQSFAGKALLVLIPFLILSRCFMRKPLKTLSDGARKASSGDFSVRFPVVSDDEVGLIAKNLNYAFSQVEEMRGRLESCHNESMKKLEKMASIGELAAAVAHEIKNPLAGISGAIQVLAEDIPGTDSRREIIKEILGEIDRLDQSIRNLLTFARPPGLRIVHAEIMSIVERAKNLMRKQAENQGIEIRILSDPALMPVKVDPEQMQQVFLNIMLNALHSMPSGGVLGVSAIQTPDLRSTEVVFSDTGMGISGEALKDIFKPFFTTKHSGTGLGLAISKNIIEKHGGSIEVESQPGLGSTFRVIIPYQQGTEDNG